MIITGVNDLSAVVPIDSNKTKTAPTITAAASRNKFHLFPRTKSYGVTLVWLVVSNVFFVSHDSHHPLLALAQSSTSQCLQEFNTIDLNYTAIYDSINPGCNQTNIGLDCVADFSTVASQLETACTTVGGKVYNTNQYFQCNFTSDSGSSGILTTSNLNYGVCVGTSCAESFLDLNFTPALLEVSLQNLEEGGRFSNCVGNLTGDLRTSSGTSGPTTPAPSSASSGGGGGGGSSTPAPTPAPSVSNNTPSGGTNTSSSSSQCLQETDAFDLNYTAFYGSITPNCTQNNVGLDCVADYSTAANQLKIDCTSVGGNVYNTNQYFQCDFGSSSKVTSSNLNYGVCVGTSCTENYLDLNFTPTLLVVTLQNLQEGGRFSNCVGNLTGDLLTTTSGSAPVPAPVSPNAPPSVIIASTPTSPPARNNSGNNNAPTSSATNLLVAGALVVSFATMVGNSLMVGMN